jgi:Skp family chaperone for outer membrane proteins
LIFVVAATAIVSGCELPTVPKAGNAAGTSIIDLDAVAKALGRDAVLREQLTQAGEQLTSKVNELASGLKGRLTEERNKLGEAPSETQQADFRKLTNQAQVQLRRGQLAARQRAQQFQTRLVSQFRAEVLPFAQQVAAARGSRVVLVKSNVLWYDPSADITQAVVAAMRAAPRAAGTLNPTPTPPPTGALPAAPASSAIAPPAPGSQKPAN